MLHLMYFIYFLLPLATAIFETYQGENCTLLMDSNNSTHKGKCMEIADCDYIGKIPKGNKTLNLCKEPNFSHQQRLNCCPNVQSTKQGENCLIWGHIGPFDAAYPNVVGKCQILKECENAKSLLEKKKREDTCSLKDKLVCCPLKKYPPIKTIADERCAEYYEVFVGTYSNGVYLGKEARPKEFPHMAAIGYNESNTTTWFCGGSLISPFFTLTAAHCTSFRGRAPNIVRLGDLDLDDVMEKSVPVDIGISKIYRHPDYKFSSHYHDIALIKLESKPPVFYIKPICLHTKDEIPFELEAAGWGATENSSRSSHLLKVSLNVTDYNNCAPKFVSVSKRKLANGIINELQICAGGFGHDTCTGDSGGPLHYKVPANVLEGHAHFVLAGVVSFGKGCGNLGVYTRVSAYISWIESLVWPATNVSEKLIDNINKSTDQIIYELPDDSRSGALFQFEGDSCILQKADNDLLSKNGTCTNVHKCKHAKELLRRNLRPQLCGFSEKDPIVCCPNTKMNKL